MAGAFVSFLSDYGVDDEFVGVCHGVILRVCPSARIIDLTHGIPRHDVRAGALTLRSALPFLPAGVHLAVVDPTVGASGDDARRAVALRVAREDRLLVGPDNGLLALAADALGGVVAAVDIGLSPHRLRPVSATFQGRDIFAPVAGALAAGVPLAEAGEPFAIEQLHGLELSTARLEPGVVVTHALALDRFGNVALDVTREQLAGAGLRLGAELTLDIGGRRYDARYATTFADVHAGELVLYEDSQGMPALAVNRGSAASGLGIRRDDELRLRVG